MGSYGNGVYGVLDVWCVLGKIMKLFTYFFFLSPFTYLFFSFFFFFFVCLVVPAKKRNE